MKLRHAFRSTTKIPAVHLMYELVPVCRTRAKVIETTRYVDRVTCARCAKAIAAAQESDDA